MFVKYNQTVYATFFNILCQALIRSYAQLRRERLISLNAFMWKLLRHKVFIAKGRYATVKQLDDIYL